MSNISYQPNHSSANFHVLSVLLSCLNPVFDHSAYVIHSPPACQLCSKFLPSLCPISPNSYAPFCLFPRHLATHSSRALRFLKCEGVFVCRRAHRLSFVIKGSSMYFIRRYICVCTSIPSSSPLLKKEMVCKM